MISLLFASSLALAAEPAASAPLQARELAQASGAHVQRPRWSPDGAKIAWEANDHDQKQISLFIGAFDGETSGGPLSPQPVRPSAGAPSALTAGFASAAAAHGVAHELSWSPPQMGHYVFSATNDRRDFDLYLSSGSPLAPAPGADGGPTWSPDGRHIVFTSSRTGAGDLYLLDLHQVDKPPRRLTTAPGASEVYPSWSPDGSQLLYVGHSASGDNLWHLPSLDARPVRLTSWPGNQVRPAFSPDGAQVAFYANVEDPDRFDLYLMRPSPDAEPKRIATSILPNATGPRFTPDGRFIVAVIDEDEAYDPLALIPVDGGAPIRLDFGTVGHGDLDLVQRQDEVWIAYVAQGRRHDPVRDFKRLFAAPLPKR